MDSNRNFDLHLRPEQTSLPSTSPLQKHFTSTLTRQTAEDWPHQEATFHWASQVETPTLEHPRAVRHSHSDRHHGYQIEDIGIHDWQQSTPTSRTTSYRICNEQPDWNILLHEEQGPRVALGLSRAIQQLFHHYQTDTGSPQMYIDATISLYVDQYPPVRLHSGWAYQLHQQLLGMDPYTNNELAHLVAYWQFAHIFQRRPKDKSQLQIPNRGQRQYHSFTGHSPRGTVHIRILDPKQPVIVDFKLFYSTDKIVVVTVSWIVFSTPSMDGPHLAYSIRLCKLAAFPKEPLSSTFSYTVLLAPKLK